MSAIAQVIARLRAGESLGAPEAEAVLGEVLDGRHDAAAIGDLLTALARKGETAEELTGFARAMRARAIRVDVPRDAVDTCGTGGSGLATVNTSTLVALVVAAAGVPVAKHGNRASSGLCGSGDVLDRAGVRVDVAPGQCPGLIDRTGIAFLFAPLFHPAMKHVGPVRKALGTRTVFNFLGPLCNPGGVRRQLLGVSSREHAPRMAQALAALGTDRSMVVSGADGLDELSLAGPSDVWTVEGDEVRQETVRPEDFGLPRREFRDFEGGDPERNLQIFDRLLDGGEGPHADHLALNAAAGLRVAGVVTGLVEGVSVARDLLASGRVRSTFEAYREAAGEVPA
jgi:anthranilate phosphoribosyltransferase